MGVVKNPSHLEARHNAWKQIKRGHLEAGHKNINSKQCASGEDSLYICDINID